MAHKHAVAAQAAPCVGMLWLEDTCECASACMCACVQMNHEESIYKRALLRTGTSMNGKTTMITMKLMMPIMVIILKGHIMMQ